MPSCSICQTKFKPKYSSLEKWCSHDCEIEYKVKQGLKAAEKYRKEKKKEWHQEKKERKENLKKHGDFENELEDEIRAIVRLIDFGCRCTSCNAELGGKNQAQAGHRWAVGSYNNLRYNLMGIFIQGVCCNKWKSANIDGYDEGIKNIYGEDVFRHVKEEMRALYPIVKLSIPELKEKTAIAKQIVKELKKLDMAYPPKIRIELRKKYNERIGIYL